MAGSEKATEYVGAICLEVFAAPFFEEGTKAVFDGLYVRAAVGYLVGLIPAIAGLLTVSNYWPRLFVLVWLSWPERIKKLRIWVGGWIGARMGPIAASPRWWFGMLFSVLVWLSWPELFKKLHGAIRPQRSIITETESPMASTLASPIPQMPLGVEAKPSIIPSTRTISTPAASPLEVPTSHGSPTVAELSNQSQIDNLIVGFLSLPRPCLLKITAPPETMGLRNQLANIAQLLVWKNGSSAKAIDSCQIIDDLKDMHPDQFGDVDLQHNYLSSGIIIHALPASADARGEVAYRFREMGMNVKEGSVLPPGSPAGLIYIEIGKSKLWK